MNELTDMMIIEVEQKLNNLTVQELEYLASEVAMSLVNVMSNPRVESDPLLVLEQCQLSILATLIYLRLDKHTLN